MFAQLENGAKGCFLWAGGGFLTVNEGRELVVSDKKQVSSGEKPSSTSQTRRGVQTGAAASSQTSGSGPTFPSGAQTLFHLECRRRPHIRSKEEAESAEEDGRTDGSN